MIKEKQKYLSIILLAIIILMNGCVQEDTPTKTSITQPATSFSVNYIASSSSSGGDRRLDITYRVENEKIISCEGTYSYPPSQEQRDAGNYDQNIEDCDVQKLINDKYNVPLKLMTNISGHEMSGKVNDRFGSYSWEIIIE